MPRTRKTIAAIAAATALALAPAFGGAPATAAPPAQSNVLTFTLPAIGGVEQGAGAVPGGSFAPIVVTAQPAPRTMQYPPPPAAVTFSVRDLAGYHAQYEHRYLLVSWRNLATGRVGVERLRHWDTPADEQLDGYPAALPTSAVAVTGGGPVVATVSVLREQRNAPRRSHCR